MKVLLSVMRDGKEYWADSKEPKQADFYFTYSKNSSALIGFRTGQRSQVLLAVKNFKSKSDQELRFLWNVIEAVSTKLEARRW